MWSIQRRHFQWPWTTSTTSFKVTPFFDAEYPRNGTTYRQFRDNTNRNLHTPYSTVSFRITLSDFEWLSKLFNDTKRARSLCDSWAYCFQDIAWRTNGRTDGHEENIMPPGIDWQTHSTKTGNQDNKSIQEAYQTSLPYTGERETEWRETRHLNLFFYDDDDDDYREEQINYQVQEIF